jgi:hypothetical protein
MDLKEKAGLFFIKEAVQQLFFCYNRRSIYLPQSDIRSGTGEIWQYRQIG